MSQNFSGEHQTSPDNHNANSQMLIHDELDMIFQNKIEVSAEFTINPVSAMVLSMGINLEKVRQNHMIEAIQNGRQK